MDILPFVRNFPKDVGFLIQVKLAHMMIGRKFRCANFFSFVLFFVVTGFAHN